MRSREPGVLQQMQWEQSSAHRLEVPWDVVLCVSDDDSLSGGQVEEGVHVLSYVKSTGKLFSYYLNWIRSRLAFVRWLNERIDGYDVVLLRYIPGDFLTYFCLKKKGAVLISVHHTLEGVEILSQGRGVKSVFKYISNWVALKKCLTLSSGIVAVTEEISNYVASFSRSSMRSYVYPNGLGATTDLNLHDARGEKPEILFVASNFISWHGLDLLLDSALKSDREFVLHLVGKLSDADFARASQDKRIVVHGVLTAAEIKDLAAKSWLGLSSFALMRKGMKQACTLKVREYLSNGLCIYSGHKDVFPEDYPFYKYGPPAMDEILDYAFSVRGASRSEVRASALPFIDKDNLLHGLDIWVKDFLKK